MKNFKKFLSAALSVALIAVTAVGGIGATAETSETEGSEIQPTVLTPIAVNNTQNGQYVSATKVQTIAATTAKGIFLTSKDGNEHSNEYVCANGDIWTKYSYHGKVYGDWGTPTTEGDFYSLADTTGVVFYLKLDKANKVYVGLGINAGAPYNYAPDMTLKPRDIYQYLPIGENEWKTGVAELGAQVQKKVYNEETEKWVPQYDDDENPIMVNKTDMYGVMSFDSAFEGYVKIPYSSLVNDIGEDFKIQAGKHTLASIDFKLGGIGGKYGNAVVGSVSLYGEDTGSTQFEYVDDWKSTPMEITPIATKDNGNTLTYITKTNIQPIGATTAQGMLITSKDGEEHEYEYASQGELWAKYCCYGTVNGTTGERSGDFYSLSGTAGLVFYVKLDGANKVYLNFAIDDNPNKKYAQEATLKPGNTYAYLEIGSDTWQTGTAVVGATNSGVEKTNMYGVMSFDKAFEGYIKIPYTSLVADAGTSFINAETMKMTHIDFKLGGIGGKYGSAVLGPVSLYSEDTGSNEFTYPTAWQSSDIEAKAVTRYEMKHWNLNVTEEVTNISALGLNGVSLKFRNDITKNAETFVSSKAYTQMQIKNSTGEGGKDAYNGKMFELPSSVKTSGALIIYVKTPAANKMCLYVKSVGNSSYFENIGLKNDGTYYTSQNGETSWQLHTSTEYITEGNTKLGLIEFDGAFEGYIKIPTGSVQWSGKDPYQIGRVEVRFSGLGGNYGEEIIVSPLMYTEQDSPSTTVNVTKAFEDGDVNRDGDIDVTDLALCKQYLLTADVKPSNVEANGGDADANYDGKADILDLIRIKKILVNKAG